MQKRVKDLNHLYRTEPALYELDFSADGFEWISLHDWEQSIISFIRKGRIMIKWCLSSAISLLFKGAYIT